MIYFFETNICGYKPKRVKSQVFIFGLLIFRILYFNTDIWICDFVGACLLKEKILSIPSTSYELEFFVSDFN